MSTPFLSDDPESQILVIIIGYLNYYFNSDPYLAGVLCAGGGGLSEVKMEKIGLVASVLHIYWPSRAH